MQASTEAEPRRPHWRCVQVAAGSCHSVAVTALLGRLYAWGWNAHGDPDLLWLAPVLLIKAVAIG
jgi:alpha-tubulin suppressor-like RCC1 family protein